MATTRKRTTRKSAAATRKATIDATPRHVWLAYLGLLVAARREATAAVVRAVTTAETTASDVRKATQQAEKELCGRVGELRSQVRPSVIRFSSEVEARLAPVLDKLGLTKQKKAKRAPRKARKTAAKATRRTTARKAAKRTARKTAR